MLKFVVLLLCTLFVLAQQDFVSVEGFVKPSAELLASMPQIDMSGVKLELYAISSSGARLKESSNCSPSGYYVFQVFTDNLKHESNYELRVSGPEGWYFEPNTKKITLTKDQTSYDVNFVFNGFSIKGKVQGRNQKGDVEASGPENVQVQLLNEQGKVIATTQTKSGGVYEFNHVSTGSYKLRAQHKNWNVESDVSVQVSLKGSSAVAPLIFKGFDVQGKVLSSASPVAGVQLTISPCPQGAVCQTNTNDQGVYAFTDIPSGTYSVTPYFKGFQVAPSQVSVTVKQDSAKVEPSFEVKGFTIRGSVEDNLANVDILVNGKKATKTDNQGKFELHEISSANRYTIEAKLANYVFEKIENAQFLPAKPELSAPIKITHVHVCGQVKLQSQVFALAGRKVFANGKNVDTSASIDEQGKFCVPVPKNAAAKISVAVSDEEKKQGLLLKPLSIEVPDHLDRPITDTSKFVFSQQMLNLFGKVKTLAGVSAAGLNINAQLLRTGTITSTKTNEDGSFAFNNVLPGNSYRVSVVAPNSGLCWFQQGQQKVEVVDTDVNNVEIKQDGFLLSLQSNIEGVVLTKQGSNEKFTLEKNAVEKCIREPGVQRFTASSPSPCIQLEKTEYEFDTTKPARIVVSAVKYLIRGEINVPAANKADDSDDSISIQVTGNKGTKATLQTKKQGNTYAYEFWAPFDESFTFEPKSGLFLLEPKSVSSPTVSVSTKCPQNLPTIKGIRGTFLRGNVHPSVAGADVKVYKKKQSGEELIVTVKTDAQGNYKAGPLYSSAQEEYHVVAEKQGFHLIRSPNNPLDFTATKLVSLQVNTVLKGSKTPLPSAFVSLVSASAGNTYRTNSLTNEQGQVTFSGLFPGSYSVRPLLKEYAFEQNNIQVEVKENGNNVITIEANRVAFSAFGKVRSLNGKPMAGVLVEAVSESNFVDEATTDQTGSFRIRGLSPKEKYTIRVKPSNTVERATPEFITVSQTKLEDVQNLEFLSFSSFGFTSELITGQVDVPVQFITGENLISTPNPIIEVELLAGKDPMSAKPIRAQKLTVTRYFQFIVPKNEVNPLNYYIRLSTNLNKQAYQYNTPMVAAKQHISYSFRPTLKTSDQQDTKTIASTQNLQFLALVLLTGGVIFYFNSNSLRK